MLKSKMQLVLLAISLVVVYYFAAYAALHGVVRYRSPVMPLLILLAIWFVANCYQAYRSRRVAAKNVDAAVAPAVGGG
jgi:hypothetical protein